MPYDLRSPVTEQELARLDDRPELVQFASALTPDDYALLGAWFAAHPAKTLRAYASYDGTVTDLEFLRHFPGLRSFEADLHSLTDLSGLRHLPDDLRRLGLGRTRRKLSLAPVARFRQLERLRLEGHTRDLAVLGGLTGLRELWLGSVTLPDLTLLTSLTGLRSLSLVQGGTQDLRGLAQLARLEQLELSLVRGPADLSPVAGLEALEHLVLQALRQVTALPDLSRLTRLRRLTLETMKGVTDLAPVAAAPALRHLDVVDMAHLQPEAFRPLVGHPTLDSLRYGLGSRRKNDVVRELVDLPSDGDGRTPLR